MVSKPFLASVVSLDLFCVLFVFLFALRFTSSYTISFSPNGKKTEISTWLHHSFSPFSPLPLLSFSPLIHSIYPFIHLSIHLYSKYLLSTSYRLGILLIFRDLMKKKTKKKRKSLACRNFKD